MILDEIQDGGPVVKWDDIAGQQVLKLFFSEFEIYDRMLLLNLKSL
jgi:hypothetical protein